MAVVALPFIAVGLGASEGGLIVGIAAAAGAYIDQRYVFPALFPPDDQVGPKFNDLRQMSAEEGASFARVFGPAVRVPGVLMWRSRNDEERHVEHVGKGGSGGNFITYRTSIYCSVAFAARGDTQTQALELDGIEQIYGNGKKIWDRDPEADESGVPVQRAELLTNTSNSNRFIKIWVQTADYDFTVIATGQDMIISGFTGAYVNNNTDPAAPWKVWQVGYGTGADASRSFLTIFRFSTLNPPVAVPVASGQTLDLFQAATRFSANMMDDDPEFYTGTETQEASPTQELYEGAGNVSGSRGIAYAVLQKLQLQDFANVTPQFEAIVSGQAEMTIGECIRQICVERDISASLIDVSLCTELIGGYAVLGPTSGVAMLQPLMVFYDIIPQMRGEVLHFFPRALAPVVEISEDDIGSFEIGADNSVRDISVIDADEVGLPTEIIVKFQDAKRHYQTGAGVARLPTRGPRVQDVVNFDLVSTSSKARSVAERLLYRSYQNSRRISFDLPASYIGLVRESTICHFSAHGQDWNVLIEKVDRGDNYTLRCEGVDEDVRHAVQFEGAEDGSGTENFTGGAASQAVAVSPGHIAFEILDIGCFRDSDVDVPGIYWGACLSQPNLAYKGCALFMSIDGGENYNEIDRSIYEAQIGNSETVLSVGAIAGMWDDTSALDVTLYDGAFENITDAQCLRGLNRLVVGNELIGFVNAEYLGDQLWRLTRLLRGLQGTEAEIATHAVGERCVLVSGPGIYFVPLNSAAIGSTRLFKCLNVGRRLEDVQEQSVDIVGATVRPFAPVNVKGRRDASNNLIVSFTPRSRGVVPTFGVSGAPQHESNATHMVDVMDKATGLIVKRRTTLATNLKEVELTYIDADQTLDGYTPGDAVNVRVTASSKWLGSGKTVAATI